MALGLTQNANLANQFCVPCCEANAGCCTSEFQSSDKESITITFNNFRYYTDANGLTCENNPYLDFYIYPFSAKLKRSDLVNSLYKANNPNVKNYGQFENASLDLLDAGFAPSQNPYGMMVNSRKVKIPIFLNPKVFSYVLNNTTTTVFPYYYYDVSYYAEINLVCFNNYYAIGATIFRELSVYDEPVEPIEGLTPVIGMIVGQLNTAYGSGKNMVLSCNPFYGISSVGTSAFPIGFHWAQDSGTAKFAYYKYLFMDNFGNQSISYNTYAFTPFNYLMDVHLTS